MQRSCWYILVKTSKYLFFQTPNNIVWQSCLDTLDFLKIIIVPNLSRACLKLHLLVFTNYLKHLKTLREESRRKQSHHSEMIFTLYFNSERLFPKFLIPKIPLINWGTRSSSAVVCIICFFWRNIREAIFITV